MNIVELHYITPIENVPSILQRGILSHSRAGGVLHNSIAMTEIQEKRSGKTVPQGRRLHDYANLYFSARNPMLFKLKPKSEDLCVLRVSPAVLKLEGVVITDGNASSDYTRFEPASYGLRIVNHELTFADDWNDQDQIRYFVKKRAKCAEVLVPGSVHPNFILGAYVASESAKQMLGVINCRLLAEINEHMFFL